jgi:hypothetical protein
MFWRELEQEYGQKNNPDQHREDWMQLEMHKGPSAFPDSNTAIWKC